MTPLFAMPGPELPDADTAIAAAGASLPELPSLSAMLRVARRLSDSADWRSGVLAHLVPALADMPAAAVAAQAAADLAPGACVCLARPLHLVPGISRVHLPHAGLLRLDAAERDAWRAAFNAEFGSTDIRLHAAGCGWLLAAPFALAARDAAPEELTGRALSRAVAGSADERALRRLGSEVEMWLANHPLNAARAARHQPAVNCLWFWGGTRLGPQPAPRSIAGGITCLGDPDPWVAGLARLCGAPVEQDASGWSPGSRTHCALLAGPGQPDEAGRWEALEARWFQPAWSALQSGELGGLRLQIGSTGWQLPSRFPWRWGRARRSWWQMVRA